MSQTAAASVEVLASAWKANDEVLTFAAIEALEHQALKFGWKGKPPLDVKTANYFQETDEGQIELTRIYATFEVDA